MFFFSFSLGNLRARPQFVTLFQYQEILHVNSWHIDVESVRKFVRKIIRHWHDAKKIWTRSIKHFWNRRYKVHFALKNVKRGVIFVRNTRNNTLIDTYLILTVTTYEAYFTFKFHEFIEKMFKDRSNLHFNTDKSRYLGPNLVNKLATNIGPHILAVLPLNSNIP